MSVCLAFPGTAAGQRDDNPPTTLVSSDCAAAFKRYGQATTPLYFAMSPDGKACAFSLCLTNCKKSSIKPHTPLALCKTAAKGTPCEIYAFRGKVISKNGVRPGGNTGN